VSSSLGLSLNSETNVFMPRAMNVGADSSARTAAASSDMV